MTQQQTDQPFAPPPEQPITVESGSDEKLAQLHALYPELKSRADAAAKELKAVTDAIKVALTSRDAEARRFTLTGADGPALALTYTVTRRFDSKRFRADQPGVYDAYLTESGSWSLRPASGGDV